VLRKVDNITQSLPALLSGILLSLSFPKINFSLAAYIAFIPLFFALRDESERRKAFFLSFVCGIVFFGITIFWLKNVSIPGYIILTTVLSIFFGIFGICFLYIKEYPLWRLFLLPACWVVLEYMRSTLFTGFGWALLGHSQYLNIPIIQIADITGAYGISFAIMLVNLSLYSLLDKDKKALPALLICLFMLTAMLGYGYFRLSESSKRTDVLNISVIQGNIPQEKKWDSAYKEEILDIYTALTKGAAVGETDLIIWPETSLPGYIQEMDLLDRVLSLAKDVDAYILIGAPSVGGPKREDIFNSAILISDNGDVVGQYNKLHLVPFGEYIPLERYIRLLRFIIDKPIGTFTRGDEYTVFKLENGARFASLICSEDIFPGLVRNFAKRDIDFLVNITNDAWFLNTGAPYQHAQSSVFRAVENRMPVIRAANTGLSCFIDADGRITDTVRIDGEEIFITGYKRASVGIYERESLYKRFGDVFVLFCAISLVIGGGIVCLKRYSS